MELVRARKTTLSLDLAPLIDVVFQLLVFFMLTSAFANPAMKITLPKASSNETLQPEIVVVYIDKAGDIRINNLATSFGTFEKDLRSQLSRSPGSVIHIKGDEDMPYKYFVQIADLSKRAGASQINIVHQKIAQ